MAKRLSMRPEMAGMAPGMQGLNMQGGGAPKDLSMAMNASPQMRSEVQRPMPKEMMAAMSPGMQRFRGSMGGMKK